MTRPSPDRADPLADFRGRCKSCRADILWAVTAGAGERMPVDVKPAAMGNVTVYIEPQRGRTPPRLIATVLTTRQRTAARANDVRLHTSHFATCPEAGHHRRKGRR